MKLQTKIMLLLLMIIAILFLVIGSFQVISIYQKRIFIEENQKSHEQVIDQILNFKSEDLIQLSLDYSGWDEMVDFALNPDTLWAADNIDMTMEAYSLAFFSVYNVEKNETYISIDSSDLSNFIVFDKQLITSALEDEPYFHFYKYFDENLYEIAGSIVVPSSDFEERITEPQGYLFVARQVNEDYIAEIQLSTNYNTKLSEINLIDTLSKNNADEIVNYRFLNDENEKHIAVFEFSSENPIQNETKTLITTSLVIIFIALITIIIFFIIIRKIVSQPIKRITQTLDNEDTKYIEEYLKKDNEFGKISMMINDFFDQKHDLQQKNIKLNEQAEEIKQQNEILYQQKEEIQAQSEMVKSINNELVEINNHLRFQTEALDASASVSIFDLNGIITYSNDKLAKILGFKSSEIKGKIFRTFLSEIHDVEFYQKLWHHISIEKKLWRGEVCLKTKSNNFLWFDSSIIPFLNDENEVYQYLSINIEITDKKLAALELKKNNKQITDSIYYAKKIQDAVLKQSFSLLSIFSDSFILFKPRDIVSGDFYFIKKIENKVIFTAADCTGHGVPGAFMSLLGISFLNEIIKNEDNLHSNIILNELRNMIKENLGQTGKIIELRNGIDMALCVYDVLTNELEYSGAYNPLYLIKNSNSNEIIEIKGDIMPVGTYPGEEKPFSRHQIKVEKFDSLYLLSDGYKDQFGGEKNSKLKASKVKEMLLKNQSLSFVEQKQKLEDFFVRWQGKNPQIDDVVILGIKF